MHDTPTATPSHSDDHDTLLMRRALDVAATARVVSPPNPWVGCVIECADGRVFVGATEAPGNRHAERVALDAARTAGADLRGATLVVTLEPCSHHGRTPPCTDALIDAGISRVVCAITDPDPRVAGGGVDALRTAGIDVHVGTCTDAATEQLLPYLHHRRTGRPYVVLKVAATLDGRTAAPDGSSQWITGAEARRRVHRLRAESGAVIVGSGTVRADDPALTVRDAEGPNPRRVVLGTAPPTARIHPCLEWSGSIADVLDHLGAEGVLQVLVEGGAKVAASFHRERLVDRYVIHLAPALMGGDDGMSMLSGLGASTIAELWRGRIVALRMLGNDIEIELVPQEVP
jgi:diaminohydroxyphosphoribosylaminopyrimidine deaminase/5-amino-6-(5-phosphoribosylamino)uracil reductase